ncbi:MAG: tripartite tricarboxylate transporter substrate binding protein [Acidovorax sp.]
MQALTLKWNAVLRTSALIAVAATAFAAQAQTYPSKPVTLIVPFPPGGASDTQFRALATVVAKDLKQPFVVVNQPGAAGTMAPANMARSAAPDGYTISVVFSSLFRLPHVQKVTYDPTKDFTYIAGISKFVYGLVVAADSPYKTAQDLVAAAKAKPGEINVGAISTGSSGHVALMRWASAAGFQPNYIPFKGSAEVMQAVLGHHVDAMTEASWGPMVQQGKFRALAVFEDRRVKQFPEVPTAKELGWNVVANAVVGLAGPKGMDPAVTRTLQNAFHRATADPAFLKTLEVAGQSVAYLDSAAYTKLANDLYAQEKRNIDDLKAAGVQLAN